MYCSLILLAPKRLTFGQRWKYKRLITTIKNKEKINPIYAIIHQCNTIEKLNEIQRIIDKKKEKFDKKKEKFE
tara:strand:- start:97 stop:315 length:219 start_codon:yes stop_codon:yes gene_type:complete